MYKAEYITGLDVPEDMREWNNNYMTVLKITYNDGTFEYYGDRYEPEDFSFDRGLSWILLELEAAYSNGYINGMLDKSNCNAS